VSALVLAFGVVVLVAWPVQLVQARERERRAVLQRQLDEANDTIRTLLAQSARMAMLYIDLNARFVDALRREAAAIEDQDDAPTAGRLVS